MTDLDRDAILAGMNDPVSPEHRAGIVGLVGRPNTGKSTLLNTLLGRKVAIVTPVAGTTRNTIRGVLTSPEVQIVFVDTPGVTKPKTLLAQRLNDRVRQTWSGMDALVLLVDVADGIGRGDQFLAEQVLASGVPVIAVANKIDRLGSVEASLPVLNELAALDTPERAFHAIVPVSARAATNVDRLVEVITALLPRGGRLVSDTMVHDQTPEHFAAEVLREQLIGRARQELPHSIAVVVESFKTDETHDDLLHIDAEIFVERPTQKGIVIGKNGENLKAAATAARHEMERLFGMRVFLKTHVRVQKEWQRDPKALDRLGY
jgi:GTP-binding protein Era